MISSSQPTPARTPGRRRTCIPRCVATRWRRSWSAYSPEPPVVVLDGPPRHAASAFGPEARSTRATACGACPSRPARSQAASILGAAVGEHAPAAAAPMIQPSPYRAARSKAASAPPPMISSGPPGRAGGGPTGSTAADLAGPDLLHLLELALESLAATLEGNAADLVVVLAQAHGDAEGQTGRRKGCRSWRPPSRAVSRSACSGAIRIAVVSRMRSVTAAAAASAGSGS